jgi:hypothetical protein
VVGRVVEVAPAPWPEAPVVPGLPAPLWTSLLVPVEAPVAVLLGAALPPVDLFAEVPPVSPPLNPMLLHAVRDKAVMLLKKIAYIFFTIISLLTIETIMAPQRIEVYKRLLLLA